MISPTEPEGESPLEEAVQTCRLLWPGREVWVADSPTRDRSALHEFLVVPNDGPPRFLLPASDRRGALNLVSRVNSSVGARGRATRTALAVAVLSGAMGRMVRRRLYVGSGSAEGHPVPTIEEELLRITGEQLSVTFGLGTVRANRKPVLSALDSSGRVRYFVKIGHTPLAKALIRGEAEALRLVGQQEHPAFVAPRCVYHGEWNGLDLLVMNALPSSLLRGWPARARPWQAMLDVAGLESERVRAVDLEDAVRRLCALTGVPDGSQRHRFAAILEQLMDRTNRQSVRLGSWHGDWAPDNMIRHGRHLYLWDWERFEVAVPWGFDAAHYCFQKARYAGGWVNGRKALETEVPVALARLGVPDEHVVLITDLYLATITARYLRDISISGVGSLGRISEMMIDILAERTRVGRKQGTE